MSDAFQRGSAARDAIAGRRNGMVTMLLLISAFNYVDRNALGLMMQDIKLELLITDTQLGLLTGIAFAFFYSILGVPIARWADRGNRVRIIVVTTALWSAAVALCGAAGSFLQLLLIRVIVGVGEAGCGPPALSLISDYFSRAERPRAVSRYMLGVPVGLLIGFFLAGWLNQFYGWRLTFVLLGLPGVALAAIAHFALIEPRRTTGPGSAGHVSVEASAEAAHSASLSETFLILWKLRAFRHVLIGFSLSSFFGYGIVQWKAAFFMRSFGLETGELGTWFALIYGLGGSLGAYAGGELAARFARDREQAQLRFMALGYAIFGIISLGIYTTTDVRIALPLLTLATLCFYTINGPLFAMIQTLVPERMRATSVALIYLFANLIGLGFGPLAAGALSDAFRAAAGEESLRYALLILSPGYLWAAVHLWLAGRYVQSEMIQSVEGAASAESNRDMHVKPTGGA